jgi:hypothetical protein
LIDFELSLMYVVFFCVRLRHTVDAYHLHDECVFAAMWQQVMQYRAKYGLVISSSIEKHVQDHLEDVVIPNLEMEMESKTFCPTPSADSNSPISSTSNSTSTSALPMSSKQEPSQVSTKKEPPECKVNVAPPNVLLHKTNPMLPVVSPIKIHPLDCSDSTFSEIPVDEMESPRSPVSDFEVAQLAHSSPLTKTGLCFLCRSF